MIKKLFLSLYQLIKTTKQMKTVGQLLKHDFKTKGPLYLYDTNGNRIYVEYSTGYWYKKEYDTNGNLIYVENSDGNWYKQEYDTNGKEIYFEDSYGFWYKKEYDANGKLIYSENSNGKIRDNRPKSTCNGKVVEIEGKKYRLTEV